MTQVYDAGLGDVIEIPGHWPVRVTVTGWENAETPSPCIWSDMQGSLCRVTWTAQAARFGQLSGVTTLSDATLVTMVAEAGPDHPLRVQHEAALEALCAALELAES